MGTDLFCPNLFETWHLNKGWGLRFDSEDSILVTNPTGNTRLLASSAETWRSSFEEASGKTELLWITSLSYLINAYKKFPAFTTQSLTTFYSLYPTVRHELRRRLGHSWDHSVALRLSALAALTGCGDEEVCELAKNFIEVETEGEDLWSLIQPNNHGFMLTQSLIESAIALQKRNPIGTSESISKASEKLGQIVDSVFGNDFFCNENSPFYHHFYVLRFKELRDSFASVDALSHLATSLDLWIDRSERVMRQIVMPDGSVPPLGDSNPMKSSYKSIPGTVSSLRTGFWVYKNEDFYLSFKCGFDSLVHKHADDTSVFLNCKGETFFADGGTHSYNYTDRRVFALRTQVAHSGLFFTDFDALHPAELYKGPKFDNVGWSCGRLYSPSANAVKGAINVAGVGLLERSLHITSENSFRISDRAISFQDLESVHRFFVPREISIEFGRFSMQLQGQKGVLSVDFDRPVEFRAYSAEKVSPYRGWSSPGPNRIEPAQLVDVLPLDGNGILNIEVTYNAME